MVLQKVRQSYRLLDNHNKFMKMYDIGEKMDRESVIAQTSSKKYYPQINIDSKIFPEIEDMKVGQKYTFTIEAKPVRFSVNENEKDGKVSSMCFEISKIGLNDDKDISSEGSDKVDKMVNKMYPKKK